MFFCGQIPRKAMIIGTGTCGLEGRKTLGKKGTDDTGKDIPVPSLGHSAVSGQIYGKGSAV